MTDDILGQINAAIAAHEAWKKQLLAVIESGHSEWGPHTLKADNLCAFGKWLYSCSPEVKASPHYSVVKQLHAQFHLEAGRVLEIALLGNQDNARVEMAGQYAKITSSLEAEMLRWREELEESDLVS